MSSLLIGFILGLAFTWTFSNTKILLSDDSSSFIYDYQQRRVTHFPILTKTPESSADYPSGIISAGNPGLNITDENVRKKLRIKLFCWVPSRTTDGPMVKRILHSWGRTCDKLIFTSTEENKQNQVVKLNINPTRGLWNIIHPAWNYIEETFADDFDWFVKLDDDTFFSGDNFKSLVNGLNPNDLYYLGHTAYHGQPTKPNSAFNIGAGHAISRGTLRQVAPFLPESKKSLPAGNYTKCPETETWKEDVQLSECLYIAQAGRPNNTRDAWGRENFLSFIPLDNFVTVRRPNSHSWFWRGKPNNTGSGVSCCSSRPILWHNLKSGHAGEFEYIDWFINHVLVDPY